MEGEAGRDLHTRAEKDGAKLIELHFTDIMGAVKSITIPVHRLKDALEKGVWFDGSSIEGFCRIHESDLYLKPDESTYAMLPWKQGVARIICDVYSPNREPFNSDPRFVLRNACEKAGEIGYTYKAGPELEFYIFAGADNGNGAAKNLSPVPHDFAKYFDASPKDLASDVRRDAVYALEKCGLEVEAAHHECGPGQHEIDFKYAEAVKAADNAITLKYIVKSIAQGYGLRASFMPKPAAGIAGSGMHVHQSLWDKGDKNAFYDANDKYGLSEIAKQFIAGQLCHAKALSAIISPTVNSYKRLGEHEAPSLISWARTNRSALIRIPAQTKGREGSVRAEIRSPDPSANPYLAFAAMLKAGLDGIENEMELQEPVEEDLYGFSDEKLAELNIGRLPSKLPEAIYELQKDKVIFDVLGKELKEKYVDAKMREWRAYHREISEWEVRNYLEEV
ncbi:type I glutamate--ammonia ligase [Candidatus Micrarchaeota archaeon]|nr:type I glutamate--ammonia ligase [Candidatus Micrarchaeota archaeon]MBU1939535.1 type I glutamate--ammonia ligase [Candidatus Micrarchaeota archaeon]